MNASVVGERGRQLKLADVIGGTSGWGCPRIRTGILFPTLLSADSLLITNNTGALVFCLPYPYFSIH